MTKWCFTVAGSTSTGGEERLESPVWRCAGFIYTGGWLGGGFFFFCLSPKPARRMYTTEQGIKQCLLICSMGCWGTSDLITLLFMTARLWFISLCWCNFNCSHLKKTAAAAAVVRPTPSSAQPPIQSSLTPPQQARLDPWWHPGYAHAHRHTGTHTEKRNNNNTKKMALIHQQRQSFTFSGSSWQTQAHLHP